MYMLCIDLFNYLRLSSPKLLGSKGPARSGRYNCYVLSIVMINDMHLSLSLYIYIYIHVLFIYCL